MTDEMMIEQKKPSALPYMLGGAAVGGLGGWGVSRIDGVRNWATDPATLERLKEIGEKPDTVELSTKQKATLDSLKAKLAELKEAEAELEAASKATLDPKANERVNYERAQADLKAEIERLTEQQKAILERGNNSTSFTKGGVKKFEEIAATELPTTHAFGKQKGKPFKGDDLKNLYNTLTTDLEKAETAMNSKLDAGLRKEKTNVYTTIEKAFKTTSGELHGKTPEQIAEYFAQKETSSFSINPKNWGNHITPTPQYDRALQIAKAYYPDVTNLTNEQWLSIATEYKSGDKVPSGWTRMSLDVKNNKGWTESKLFVVENSAAKNLLTQEQQRVANLRTQAADQIFAETQRAFAIKANEVGLADRVVKDFDLDNVVKKTGLYDSAANKMDMTKLIAEGKGSIAHGSSTGYVADIAKLSEAIESAAPGKTPSMPSVLNGTYTTSNVEEALKQAQLRQRIFKSYNKQSKAIEAEFKACLENNAIIQEYNQKIANEIASDTAVQKARGRLAEQFPALFGEKTATKLTEEEIATQAKAWAEKNINKSYQDAVDSTKKLFDEAVAKNGAVDNTAKELAQGKVDKCKGELEKMGKEFCSTNKGKLALVIGGTAVAGALIAMALKPKNNA